MHCTIEKLLHLMIVKQNSRAPGCKRQAQPNNCLTNAVTKRQQHTQNTTPKTARKLF